MAYKPKQSSGASKLQKLAVKEHHTKGFLRRHIEKTPQILIIKDSLGRIFGSYLSEPIVYTTSKYVGTGESFLFRIHPNPQRYGWMRNDFDIAYYAGLHDSLDFGGNGIKLDARLNKGLSVKTDTFGNDCLPDPSKDQEYFSVIDIEVLSLRLG